MLKAKLIIRLTIVSFLIIPAVTFAFSFSSSYCPQPSELQQITTTIGPNSAFFQGVINRRIARSVPMDMRPFLNKKGTRAYSITLNSGVIENVSCEYEIKNNDTGKTQDFVISNKISKVKIESVGSRVVNIVKHVVSKKAHIIKEAIL